MMYVGPSSAPALAATPPAQALPRGLDRTDGPFSEVMTRLLQEVNTPQTQAEEHVTQFLTGEADSVNDVVLSVAKADLTFRLFMEIRNRLISSYQEIQRMQV